MKALNPAAVPLLAAGMLVGPDASPLSRAHAATRPTVFQTLRPFDSHGRLVARATTKVTPRGASCIAVTGRRDTYRCFIGTTRRNWLAKDWSTAHVNWPLLRNAKAGNQWLAPIEINGKVSLQLVAVAYR